LFRDYLRANRAASRDYAQVKRAAAALWHDDGLAYTDAKSEIILDTLEAAEAWSAAGRPGSESPGPYNPRHHTPARHLWHSKT
jgi:hypothetical protein